MIEGQPFIQPPPSSDNVFRDTPNSTSTDGRKSHSSRETPVAASLTSGGGLIPSREVTLTDDEYDELSGLLRGITIGRAEILKGMVFALDHADAHKEIVTTIAESLTLGSTPLPTKVARLYLLSDILHNSQCGRKNASSYRSGFQSHLKGIMASFGEAYKNSTGRMTAMALKDQVVKVLEVWDRWSLYPSHFIQELVHLFLGTQPPAKMAAPPAGSEDVDGEPMDDIDGDPMDEDLDGEPMEVEGQKGEDLDGEPLDGEDIDGEAIDGEPSDGPDFRRLPLSELAKICTQLNLPSHGTQEQLIARLAGAA